MSACSEAFHTLRDCAIMVVGVAGSMPAHGIGTACFVVKAGDTEYVLSIHNCLLCHGEDRFNLVSVSQALRSHNNEITFSAASSRVSVPGLRGDLQQRIDFGLVENDGLYEWDMTPLYLDDPRVSSLPHLDLTMADDPGLWKESNRSQACINKAPTKLGIWHCKVLWVSRQFGLGMQAKQSEEYEGQLKEFCDSYIVPPSQPHARRTYRAGESSDMAELSLRFMGVGTDRLVETLKRSRGLTPMSKKKGENVSIVPPLNFPQGKWKAGKTPRVTKGKVENLHRASIGEVCFTDTFETTDTTYRYGQVVVEYRSRYGDVFPIRSRKKVAWAFVEFCCRHFVPLILIRDNIAENTGGELAAECHRRGVKSAFSCPYTPQQDYAEGYLGRITVMASFAMVLSGAPIFMWRWAVMCAAFINNITATFYKKEQVWATPWELVHGEPFPDSSIVVPFGCAALVMLTEDEKEKFKSTCAMLIFIHYALDHPLYTYAFFSPRTKRVVFRQDCIFLPATFPMREARTRVGLIPDGEILVTYRSQHGPGKEEGQEGPFGRWKDDDPLPAYQDHVTGFELVSPPDGTAESTPEKPSSWPNNRPSHPAFGPPSAVKVFQPWKQRQEDKLLSVVDVLEDGNERVEKKEENPEPERPRRTGRSKPSEPPFGERPVTQKKRVAAKDRWFYQLVEGPKEGLKSHEAQENNGGESESVVGEREKEEQKFLFSKNTETNENDKNVAITDQSKCVLGEKNLLEEDFDFEEMTSAPATRHESCFLSTLPGNNFNLEEKLVDNFTGDTLIEALPGYLCHAKDNEEAAWDLQGLVFQDEELGWCTITDWGVDHGTNIVFYAPVGSLDFAADEEHASLAEVLTWIQTSPEHPRLSDYKSSRVIKRSNSRADVKELMMRCLHMRKRRPRYGTMLALRTTGMTSEVKVLSSKTIIKILKAQDTMFKYGTFIPRSDREAEQSPEAPRWRSGRALEWLRLRNAQTFQTDWTWERIRKEHPTYLKSDIGHMFYVYDYKYSGEHRVRLVFDGSQQSPTTYSVTYAPTVRAESVRLFHLYAVEYGWPIQQYDVPQAFLRSDADCTIFVQPPKGQSDYPGQILKLSKMLYGSKQAAALWFNLLNTFLLSLGFQASSMDACFYRRPSAPNTVANSARSDAIIILHVDDMRVAAEPEVLKWIHDKLFEEFQITTSDTGRFLGMDVDYNLSTGVLKMHMATYIESTVQRFTDFDLTKGIPYRELVGSLLWIVLCVIGPELLRVKDLAKRSNSYTIDDYHDALKVLDRVVASKHHGIIFRRGGAHKEYIPSKTRLGGGLENSNEETYSIGDQVSINELEENNLYKLDPNIDDIELDIIKVLADVNDRFTMVAYSDASFAVGETKQSISGFIILINGTPILWGSLKQTVVVDSTCSAEYVAASVGCKQIMHAENMVQFLDFSCAGPYKMYTDSQACLKIATNSAKLGMVRHLEIRYHLVRCLIMSGNITMEYCITEEMLADLFTKIVTTAQDKRLATRFYNDCVMDDELPEKEDDGDFPGFSPHFDKYESAVAIQPPIST